MNVIIEEIVSEFPVLITEEVVQIEISDVTSYFDLVEILDTNFTGKNGYVPTVNESSGKLVLQQPTGGGGSQTLQQVMETGRSYSQIVGDYQYLFNFNTDTMELFLQNNDLDLYQLLRFQDEILLTFTDFSNGKSTQLSLTDGGGGLSTNSTTFGVNSLLVPIRTSGSGFANFFIPNNKPAGNYNLATTDDIPTIDATPTDGSSNAVSSNGVFDALATKEPTITAGTTGQYYRGDKTFQTLDKSAVGLGNVDNTSDANKPVSTATQTALNLKQNSLGFTPEDSANKSTSTSDSASSVKFPVWSAILSYFDVTRIKTILGITTLSGNNTGDDATNSQYSGLATSKQDTLVSGTNIKTINGNSILGSGDIVISGSGITAEEAIGYSLIFG
jgi:hypothetical protein